MPYIYCTMHTKYGASWESSVDVLLGGNSSENFGFSKARDHLVLTCLIIVVDCNFTDDTKLRMLVFQINLFASWITNLSLETLNRAQCPSECQISSS